MEAAIRTPELVGLIMDQLCNFGCKPTMRHCTLVNRLFSQEAIRVLWSSLDSLAPLVQLLPGNHMRTLKVVSTGSFKLTDWNRVLRYAPLVRQLRAARIGEEEFFRFEFNNLCSAIMRAYTFHFPNRPLLPNLTNLECRGLQHFFLVPLLCPSISRLVIASSGWLKNEDITLALEAIGKMPNLRILSLLAFAGSKEQVDQLSKCLEFKTALTELSLLTSQVTLEHLSLFQSLSLLSNLSFSTDGLDILDESAGGKAQVGFGPIRPLHFSKLLELTLKGNSHRIASIIRDLHIHPRFRLTILTDLELDPFGWVDVPESTGELATAIGTIPEGSLKSIVISKVNTRDSLYHGQHHPLESSVIWPLLRFETLRELALDIRVPIDLNDADLSRIVHAFPNLVEIDLGGSLKFCRDYVPKLTPQSLIQLAQECPHLTSISLFLNFDRPGSHRYHDLAPSNSLVTRLRVGPSYLPTAEDDDWQVEDVAYMLSALFPLLVKIRWSDKVLGMRQNSAWADVVLRVLLSRQAVAK